MLEHCFDALVAPGLKLDWLVDEAGVVSENLVLVDRGQIECSLNWERDVDCAFFG